jgi:hypothetical protein
LHITAGICAFVFAALALFIYEDEQGKLQNRLEDLWVNVDDLSKSAMSKEAALIQQAAKMLSGALDRVFGTRLFSWKAIASSTGLSLASFLFVLLLPENRLLWLGLKYPLWLGLKYAEYIVVFCLAVVCVLISIAPGRIRYATFIIWAVILTRLLVFEIWLSGLKKGASFTAVVRALLQLPPDLHLPSLSSPLGAVVGGVPSDILVVVLIRWLLYKASTLRSTWKLVGLLFLDICIGIVLLAPFKLSDMLWDYSWSQHPHVNGYMQLSLYLWGMGMSNLVTILISLFIVLLLLSALLHRATWPVIARPIYAAQRYGLVSHPKLLAGLAATCLLLAWPRNPVVAFLAKVLGLGG